MKNRYNTQRKIRNAILAVCTIVIVTGGVLQLCHFYWGKLLTIIGLMVGIIALLSNSAINGIQNQKIKKEED
jgi:ATP/ADP translocase